MLWKQHVSIILFGSAGWATVQASPKNHSLPVAPTHSNQEALQAMCWGAAAETQILGEITSDQAQLVIIKPS